jgi:hypothetical protein
MKEESYDYSYQETSENPDTHHSILTQLVSRLLEDGQEAMADVWDTGQTFWPSRPLDSLIRTAELKTLRAAARH